MLNTEEWLTASNSLWRSGAYRHFTREWELPLSEQPLSTQVPSFHLKRPWEWWVKANKANDVCIYFYQIIDKHIESRVIIFSITKDIKYQHFLHNWVFGWLGIKFLTILVSFFFRGCISWRFFDLRVRFISFLLRATVVFAVFISTLFTPTKLMIKSTFWRLKSSQAFSMLVKC